MWRRCIWVIVPAVTTGRAVFAGRGGTVALIVAVIAALPATAGAATWTLQSTPDLGATDGGRLYGVSCTALSACMTVGGYRDVPAPGRTGSERWDGTSWSVQSMPIPPGQLRPSVNSVSCAGRTCTAVGSGRLPYEQTMFPLAERWNGSGWAVQRVANPGKANGGVMSGVSCTGPSACTTDGYYFVDGIGDYAPVAERWDGIYWAPEAIQPPSPSSYLSWVSCTATARCEAVGNYFDRAANELPFAAAWDGTKWRTQQIERWDGTGWTIDTSPNPVGAEVASFDDVSCISATACTAVGFWTDANGASHPLAEARR